MPQIAQLAETYASQAFWLVVIFGFIFFVVGLGMVPKVVSTVDLRDKQIADDLATAKAAFAKADELEAEHRTKDADTRAAAHTVLGDAKSTAARNTEKHVAAADAKIADHVAAAEARIAEATKAALADIELVAAEAAQDMVARISGMEASPASAQQAVKAALANV
jgi:F-type H+-transporting ATPase subunit b